MKKLLITCGIALAAVGIYTGAFAEQVSTKAILDTEIQAYHEAATGNFQDTLPGRKKRDTTNRKPMPRDTTKKDTLRASVFMK
ncbi:MAG: hypothetical protein ABW036_11980 [Flavitalea sp.]